MRGDDEQTGALFSYVSCEARVPADHPLRLILAVVDEALDVLSPEFDRLYARVGRPSIAPEKLLRALLLQAFYSIRSERQLMEQLDYNRKRPLKTAYRPDRTFAILSFLMWVAKCPLIGSGHLACRGWKAKVGRIFGEHEPDYERRTKQRSPSFMVAGGKTADRRGGRSPRRFGCGGRAAARSECQSGVHLEEGCRCCIGFRRWRHVISGDRAARCAAVPGQLS